MDEPKSLDSLFKEKIFRIPDYQRGYAWQPHQLTDFWEDLVNLPEGRSHYTGVLTLKAIENREIKSTSKEFWLVDDHSYNLFHIVDGQQRLTTFVILLQAFVDFVMGLSENDGKSPNEIYITDSLNVADVTSRYLYKVKPTGDQFRTYKFGYEEDNPSDEYLRYRILNEEGAGSVAETFYTLNLGNAKTYFYEQIRQLHASEGMQGLSDVYRKLTKQFLFNEYAIRDEFDVFVAFETMNNRGKKLSDLELLKNRLIYLTTLYDDSELDDSERKSLRDTINDAWKEVYHQLGRNKTKPLNDDDFLRAHWTMYFKYSRQTGRDYIRFLLDEQFSAKRVHKKVVSYVPLEDAEEQRDESDDVVEDLAEEEVEASQDEMVTVSQAELSPTDIRDYVLSLKESAVHWFRSFYPDMAENMSDKERAWIDRINRAGITYFRPLIMAILKNADDELARISVFRAIERFIFIVFRMTQMRSNYRSSEFYNAARGVDQNEMSLDEIENSLAERMQWAFDEQGKLKIKDFQSLLEKKFNSGSGYYGWAGLRYFLYEYELSLLKQSRQKKVDWSDLLKTKKDRISIEHIYPQTDSKYWEQMFSKYNPQERERFKGTLGNLLLLSAAINSSLQNDSFPEKRTPRRDADNYKVRNGYCDGSHSEIEVSQFQDWGPDEIRERGIKLLRFMEERWAFEYESDQRREELLFLGNCESQVEA